MANETIKPSTLDWSGKSLFKDFQVFIALCRWIFAGPLHNAKIKQN